MMCSYGGERVHAFFFLLMAFTIQIVSGRPSKSKPVWIIETIEETGMSIMFFLNPYSLVLNTALI